MAKANNIAATLAQRQKVYGSFETNAQISQDLKAVMHSTEVWAELTPHQKEALEMIAAKISRTLSCDPNHKDNWHDIAGYATLVEQSL